MESGFRIDAGGEPVPRLIIETMVATFDGAEVFRAEWSPGIAANPYLSFMLKIDGPGALEVVWSDEAGNVWRDGAEIALA
jgi:sulfur-oxidizing protein SoxZ